MIGAAASVVAGLGLSLLSGAAVLAALGGDGALNRSLPLRLALSWGLGAGLTAGSVWLLGWLGAPLNALTVGTAVVAVATPAVVLARRAARRASSRPVPGLATPARSERPWERRVFLALLVGIGALVLLTGALSVRSGAGSSDAHSIWLLKARVVFVDGGFDGRYWHDWPDGHDRRGYPPLVALLGTWVHLLAGRLDDGLVKLVFASFQLALLALVYDAVARHLPRWAAALATFLFALTGMTVVLTIWGVADLPLAFFLLAALHSVALGGGRGVGVASVLLAAAAFTKLEGSVGALLIAAACGVGAAPGLRWRSLLRLLLPAALLVLLWVHFLNQRGIPLLVGPAAHPSIGVAGVASRLGVALAGLASSALRPGWLFAWPLFGVALALAAARRSPGVPRTWSLVVLATLAAYVLVLSVQTIDLPWLIGTTGTRLLYHVFPLAFTVTVITLGRRSDAA